MRSFDARGLPAEEVAAKVAGGRASLDRPLAAARDILEDVRRRGDVAVVERSERFDGVRPASLLLPRSELEAAFDRVPQALRDALAFAARQIEAFHRAQMPVGYEIAIGSAGSRAGQQPRAMDRVGVYVPGGPRGYPSSALMGCIPARLAGVREILVATPPARETGRPSDAVLAAAALGGADEVLVAGGAQAIAAMAYGTPAVRSVDKIVGPGNLYVTAAKLLVQDRVATDGVAGPSEILVAADESLGNEALAAELLAQVEHDPDAVAWAVLCDGRPVDPLIAELERRAKALPRGDLALEALRRNGWILRASGAAQAVEIANVLAPEHLVLAVRDARPLLYAVRNAGSVFLGPWSTAAFGDYTAGTNHILPTAGSARWRGGLGVADFLKFVTYVDIAPGDVRTLGEAGIALARAEAFEAHAAALASRIALAPEVAR